MALQARSQREGPKVSLRSMLTYFTDDAAAGTCKLDPPVPQAALCSKTPRDPQAPNLDSFHSTPSIHIAVKSTRPQHPQIAKMSMQERAQSHISQLDKEVRTPLSRALTAPRRLRLHAPSFWSRR